MLITEIIDVVGKDVGADTEFGAAAHLIGTHHLAVLQHVAVALPGRLSQCRFDCIQRDFRRFIAIGMDMHLNAGRMESFTKLMDLFRCGVPDPIRMSGDI